MMPLVGDKAPRNDKGKELEMKKRNGKSWARGTVFAWLLFIILLEITIGTADIRREQAPGVLTRHFLWKGLLTYVINCI